MFWIVLTGHWNWSNLFKSPRRPWTYFFEFAQMSVIVNFFLFRHIGEPHTTKFQTVWWNAPRWSKARVQKLSHLDQSSRGPCRIWSQNPRRWNHLEPPTLLALHGTVAYLIVWHSQTLDTAQDHLPGLVVQKHCDNELNLRSSSNHSHRKHKCSGDIFAAPATLKNNS